MNKMNKSWERNRDAIHSPEGVEELKRDVKYGLLKLYTGLAESMWRYEFSDPSFDLMREMSRDTVPEKFLFNNGECCWFRDPGTDTIHCLPYTYDTGGLNMYGYPTQWRPVPVGWDDNKTMPASMQRIHDLILDSDNSVIMRNDLFGAPDKSFTEAMVNELVDNVLTMNQLQLIAKCPFVFNVSEDNLLSAKNYFLALAENKPVIFTNLAGERMDPVVQATNTAIDPALFEVFDRFECMLLTFYGFPCVPITKRAQQTVSEVQSNDSKLTVRRQEKLKQREQACERISEILGATVTVVSVVDEYAQQAMEDAQGDENEEGDEDERL